MLLEGYDFLDFGASTGDSMDLAVTHFGGQRGMGVDKDPGKIARMRDLGYHCMAGDITRLDLPAKSVRFVTMNHVLEHLPDLHAVALAIESAARAATDFLFIQGPFFDADDALARHGLKFYWSDWRGHPCHLTTRQLYSLLHVHMARDRVRDSADPCIHPLSSPRDQHAYQIGVHPPKPHVRFKPPAVPVPVYREIVCVVRLREFDGWHDAVRAAAGASPSNDTVISPEMPPTRRWLSRMRYDGYCERRSTSRTPKLTRRPAAALG